jgi:hypothetical protein
MKLENYYAIAGMLGMSLLIAGIFHLPFLIMLAVYITYGVGFVVNKHYFQKNKFSKKKKLKGGKYE